MTNIILAVAFIILAPFIGALLEGFDRKISARMQGRTGPSVLQPLFDVKKLLSKEAISVNGLQSVLVFSYLAMVIITGVLLYLGLDLLMIFFVLTTAAMFLVLAGGCTSSPFSGIGTQRELLQMMSYEPAVLLAAVGFYLATGSFKVSDIVAAGKPAALLLPGMLLAFVFILTIKMRKSPFDLSTSHHAHQELVKGVTTEISGPFLAAVEIAEWYENVFLLSIVGLFFIGGGVVGAVIAALVVWFLEILIDNTSARVTWQLTLKSAWIVTLVLGGLDLLVLSLI